MFEGQNRSIRVISDVAVGENYENEQYVYKTALCALYLAAKALSIESIDRFIVK